jgi:starvation-inducible DNA-binding protein
MSVIAPNLIKEVASRLAILLADTYALQIQVQFCHWNCNTINFYSIHKLLDEHYEILSDQVDLVAERIRALNFIAPAGFDSFGKRTSIGELKVLPATPELVMSTLYQSHALLVDKTRDLCNFATEANDAGTNTLLADIILVHEKMMWMLSASAVAELEAEETADEPAATSM